MRLGPERHQIAHQRRGAADCGQYRQTAKAVDALTRIRGAAGSARRRKIDLTSRAMMRGGVRRILPSCRSYWASPERQKACAITGPGESLFFSGDCFVCSLGHSQWFGVALSLTLPLSNEIPWPYNRPFPFHRLVLRSAQRNFPFGAAVVVIKSDGVGNLKVAVDCAIEAGCVAGMAKLRRWGFADWANEGHGLSARRLFLVRQSPKSPN